MSRLSHGISESIAIAPDLRALSDLLVMMTSSDVVTDEKLRITLKHRAPEIITLSRQAKIEGRSLDIFHWIVSFPEFLLENAVQEEMRLSGLGRTLFHNFVRILDTENRSIVEYKEILRAIGTIPRIADIAWNELYKSPLNGLTTAIETEDGIARLLSLVVKMGSVLFNKRILKAVNSRANEISVALEGKKNPDLVRNLLGGIILLRSSPWPIKKLDLPKSGNIDAIILDSLLLRTIKYIPEIKEISELAESKPLKFRILLERMIDQLGWPFTRGYLAHASVFCGEHGSWLLDIVDAMQPLGGINVASLNKLISQGIPIPRQIIQTALGFPDEYILSYDVLELENFVSGFRSDGYNLESAIEPMKIQPFHLENCRTGIRLDEAILGDESLIKVLVDMNSDQAIEIAASFTKGLLVSPYHSTMVKKVAVKWLRTLGLE